MADLTEAQASASTKIIGSDSTGAETSFIAAQDGSADGALATLVGLVVRARSTLFNGSTWDRGRSATIGTNVADTGIAAAAQYAKYAAPSAISSGNLAILPCDESGVPLSKRDIESYSLLQKNFGATTGMNAIATVSETSYFLLKNPSGSGKALRIFQTRIGHQATTASNGILFNFYANPTVTANGTSLTPVNQRIVSGAAATVAQAFRSPTTTSFGTKLFESQSFGQFPSLEMNFPHQIILDANNTLLVSVTGTSINLPVHVSMTWSEI